MVDYPGAGGWSALTFAAERQFTTIARNLVAAGADPNWRGWDKNTPLMWAASRGDYEIVELLLSKGAKASLHNKEGSTSADLVKKEMEEVHRYGLTPEEQQMFLDSYGALENRLRTLEKAELAEAKSNAHAKKSSNDDDNASA